MEEVNGIKNPKILSHLSGLKTPMVSSRIKRCDDQILHSNLSRMNPLFLQGRGEKKDKGWFIQLAISEEQQSLSEKAVV